MFSTGVGKMVNRGQVEYLCWNDAEIAALLDIWEDDKIQSQLDGAYRNDYSGKLWQPLLLIVIRMHDPMTRFFFASLQSSVILLLAAREKGIAARAI